MSRRRSTVRGPTTVNGAGRRPENLVLRPLSPRRFFCVALVGTLAKVSGQYTSTGVLLLFQNPICFLSYSGGAARRSVSLRTGRIGLHVLRAATGTACWYALFFAITQIPLSNATLLTYSAPLWMPLVAWVATRQRVSRTYLDRRGHRIRRGDPRAFNPRGTPSAWRVVALRAPSSWPLR